MRLETMARRGGENRHPVHVVNGQASRCLEVRRYDRNQLARGSSYRERRDCLKPRFVCKLTVRLEADICIDVGDYDWGIFREAASARGAIVRSHLREVMEKLRAEVSLSKNDQMFSIFLKDLQGSELRTAQSHSLIDCTVREGLK